MVNDSLTTIKNRDEAYKLRKRFHAIKRLGTFGEAIAEAYDQLGQDYRTALTGFFPIPIWKILENLQGFYPGVTNDGIDYGPGISIFEFYELTRKCQWLSFDFKAIPSATVRLRSSERRLPDEQLPWEELLIRQRNRIIRQRLSGDRCAIQGAKAEETNN